MAIRNSSQAPVYVNTCARFDLEAAAKAGGSVFCPWCEQVKQWDDRQGVLCSPVSDNQRAVRRQIVVQLHEDRMERERIAKEQDTAQGQ